MTRHLLAAFLFSSMVVGTAHAGPKALTAPGEGLGRSDGRASGTLYVLSNDPAGSAVLAFARASDGTLSPAGTFATGGTGTGVALGSQGALTLSRNGRWLLAANAGSDDISIFAVSHDGSLELVDRAPSGGDAPISVTATNRSVFVVNAGVPNSVSGFRIGRGGKLEPIPDSTRPLSAGDAAPAQVLLDPGGERVVVTEKTTNRISVYEVEHLGRIEGPRVFAASGETPFGFAFTRDELLVVSEAFGGRPGESAVSSYRLDDEELHAVTNSAPDFQGSACWIAITEDGRYAYAANTGSDDLSGYAIGEGGTLRLLDEDGVTATAGDAPADMAISGEFLYVRNGGDGSISGFRVGDDGGLEPIELVFGLPAGAAGLAAR